MRDEITNVTILREETQDVASLWCGVYRSDAESNPVFVLAESKNGERVKDIFLEYPEYVRLLKAMKHLESVS
jgi:hypothetical protein